MNVSSEWITGSVRLRNNSDNPQHVLAEPRVFKHVQPDGFSDEYCICVPMHGICHFRPVSIASLQIVGSSFDTTSTEDGTLKLFDN